MKPLVFGLAKAAFGQGLPIDTEVETWSQVGLLVLFVTDPLAFGEALETTAHRALIGVERIGGRGWAMALESGRGPQRHPPRWPVAGIAVDDYIVGGGGKERPFIDLGSEDDGSPPPFRNTVVLGR